MINSKLLSVVTLTMMLSACAQGVWVRPGTSLQEAQQVISQCDYNATVDTRPSDIRLGGAPHRHHQQSHAIVEGLAEGILGAIDESVRKDDLMRKCMMAQGFYLQTTPTAPVVTASVIPPSVQASANASALTETAEPPVAEKSVPPMLQQQAALVTKPPAQNLDTSMRLAVFQQSREGPVPNLTGFRSLNVPVAIDERVMMTTRMMSLSDRSPAKQMFLLGACSAGDVTACILSELEPRRANSRQTGTRRAVVARLAQEP